ncbi:hypothetical protein AVEN_133271-1 [Araneus ventricosus]|uniref:RNase H type-1 domain-containing protein n=1 Tax=Araneus ventricosus TaxID=182803 RepID=A0A4Y2DJT8_ARAVE|nr:hypothetical protein AVEN_133271-1 [Araneus ventricosus]
MKATGWSIHPSEHLEPNQISLKDGEANIVRKKVINIFTDGSKTEHGVGAAFCVLTNDITRWIKTLLAHRWQGAPLPSPSRLPPQHLPPAGPTRKKPLII